MTNQRRVHDLAESEDASRLAFSAKPHSLKSLLEMEKMVNVMAFSSQDKCDGEACFAGKAVKDPHKSSTNIVADIGDVISGDWQDKLSTAMKGETISLQLMDWASRKSWSFQLRKKNEFQATVISLITAIKTYLGGPVKTLFLDQGTNFTSHIIKVA